MGRIPQSFINDLLGRVDIVDVIDARLTLKKAGRNYQALCPFHNEKTPSFSVSPDKQFYHCFGCGVSGTALTFLMEFDRLEFVEAVETLARMAGVEVPREGGARPQKDHSGLLDLLARAERHFRRALKAAPQAVAYLRGRGLSGEIARDFGIGFAPDSWDTLKNAFADVPEARLLEAGLLTRSDAGRVYDRFRGRVMFPIRDTRGRVIGFGGRVLSGDAGPKYLNSPETEVFHKGRELYGLYEARRALRRLDRLLVVEGYMDVVALAQAGLANSVATLGTSATPDHFRKLYRYTEEVVCCFDGDHAGRQAAWRALESALPVLEDGRQLKFMFLPEGEDPDSLVRARGKAAFLELAGNAQPAIEYLFGRLAEGLDLASLDGRARLAALAAPHLEAVPEGTLRRLMQQRLQTLTGLGAAAAPAPAPGVQRGRPRPAATGRGAASAALARRLLALLLRRPGLLHNLAAAQREALIRPEPSPHTASGAATGPEPLARDGDAALFAEVARYVGDHPDADSAEILGRWSGTAVHERLLGLLAQPPALPADMQQSEFTDGVDRYLDLRRRAAGHAKLAEVRQAPSRETLAEYWSHRQRGGDEPR